MNASRPVRKEGETDGQYLGRYIAYNIQVTREAEAEISALKEAIRCMKGFDEAVGRLYHIYLPAEEGIIEMLEHIDDREILRIARRMREEHTWDVTTDDPYEDCKLLGAEAMRRAVRDRLIERGRDLS